VLDRGGLQLAEFGLGGVELEFDALRNLEFLRQFDLHVFRLLRQRQAAHLLGGVAGRDFRIVLAEFVEVRALGGVEELLGQPVRPTWRARCRRG
jgi:hypothetical protein